jgi:hypothetical protein
MRLQGSRRGTPPSPPDMQIYENKGLEHRHRAKILIAKNLKVKIFQNKDLVRNEFASHAVRLTGLV